MRVVWFKCHLRRCDVKCLWSYTICTTKKVSLASTQNWTLESPILILNPRGLSDNVSWSFWKCSTADSCFNLSCCSSFVDFAYIESKSTSALFDTAEWETLISKERSMETSFHFNNLIFKRQITRPTYQEGVTEGTFGGPKVLLKHTVPFFCFSVI